MRNPPTKEAFAEWCEKQPANEQYNFHNARTCAVAQFLKSKRRANYDLASDEIPTDWLNPVAKKPWTFGALARRLRAS